MLKRFIAKSFFFFAVLPLIACGTNSSLGTVEKDQRIFLAVVGVSPANGIAGNQVSLSFAGDMPNNSTKILFGDVEARTVSINGPQRSMVVEVPPQVSFNPEQSVEVDLAVLGPVSRSGVVSEEVIDRAEKAFTYAPSLLPCTSLERPFIYSVIPSLITAPSTYIFFDLNQGTFNSNTEIRIGGRLVSRLADPANFVALVDLNTGTPVCSQLPCKLPVVASNGRCSSQQNLDYEARGELIINNVFNTTVSRGESMIIKVQNGEHINKVLLGSVVELPIQSVTNDAIVVLIPTDLAVPLPMVQPLIVGETAGPNQGLVVRATIGPSITVLN